MLPKSSLRIKRLGDEVSSRYAKKSQVYNVKNVRLHLK